MYNYVYLLMDTSKEPNMPFYVGKGTGNRAYGHLTSKSNATVHKLSKQYNVTVDTIRNIKQRNN